VQLSRNAPVFQQRNLGFARPVQLDVNPFEHGMQIAGNIRIPEANDAISLLLEPKLPFPVVLRCLFVVMVPTIKFDNEPLGGAEEIYDVWSDGCLTPEVRPLNGEFL
jgi:hypothetical protein